MTESRLDRLLKLIDTAQSPAYRRLAAKQLGALVQSQPNQTRPLLKMLEGMIYNKNWDTRIACGYAIEYIFTALPAQFTDFHSTSLSGQSELLKEMDLTTEIRSRKALLASAGSEFVIDLTISAAERLRINRANVMETLGLDSISGMEDLEKELVRDEDLTAGFSDKGKIKPAEPVIDLEKLSARERIAMKRKARLASQSQGPASKQVKKPDDNNSNTSSNNNLSSMSASSASESNLSLDSFESIESDALWFCERMKEKLLNPNWHVRHGALLGLRGVLGRGIPLISSADSGVISESQEGWIDFLLCDILLILGLDRFGDFVRDQVVSPVKETAAQLLSLIYKRLGEEKRNCLIDRHLKSLMSFEQWQVRHAGILSLKYIILNVGVVEIDAQLCERVVDLLSDGDEDVRSVAADVLGSLLSTGQHSSINLERIFGSLQVLLKGLDELSPSVAPILDLLGNLVELNPSFGVESSLLLPFIRHASTKVRKQVIKVLGAINVTEGEEMRNVLIELIQSMAIELDREINDFTLELVMDFLTISEGSFDNRTIDNFFEIVTQPLGHPYSVNNFKFVNGPASHDLGFKKSDMMLISEEEGIVQRVNVAKVLKSILSTSSDYADIGAKQREKLTKSQWWIHHLVNYIIFGPYESAVIVDGVFNELGSLYGTLQTEFCRFSQIICSKEAGIHKTIEEFNTRTEKSIEAINQLAVLEGVRSTFDSESEKYKARFNVFNGKNNVAAWLDALRIENNSRLQEFYAVELVKAIESDAGELLNVSLLKSLGEFMNLERLADPEGEVINAQKDWIEFNRPNDSVWRAGRFIFKEFSKSPVFVSKSVAIFEDSDEDKEGNMNWLVALLNNIKGKEISELVVDRITIKYTGLNTKFQVACSSLAFALLVKSEILVNGTSKSLEHFLHKVLFKSSAQEIFSVILELLNRTLETGSDVILPIVPILLKRTLMEINDSDSMTRKFASLTFSQLVKIAPLAGGVRSSVMSVETENLVADCREFLDQLQGPSTSLPDYIPPCKLNVEMRPYQQAGLNWLAFLRKFNLHGALCDDMGLGKTLQTLSIIASDHFEHKGDELRTLIVCPSSLTGHWEAEVRQYCPTLKEPLLYVGSSMHRHQNLLTKLSKSEIVVTSYEVLRSDSEYFTGLQWNYCVLDEGHLIKNPKTKLSAAVRGIKAKRRLLLSGTPIQNNLLELWALFDFLLPGYLGSEKEFTDRYAKPILVLQHQQSANAGNDSGAIGKWTQKDFDEAEQKLQSLHKQVLPFILRRMKEDVLADLPPKIIQDYKCPMSSIQRILYDDLMLKGKNGNSDKTDIQGQGHGQGQGIGDIEESLEGDFNDPKQHTHVFQLLQQLRKLCVHPSLILTNDHAKLDEVNSELSKNNLKLTDLSVAPKFQMLKELLVECGLGGAGGADEDSISSNSACGLNHRVLIFAQHKSTLDLIENLVFKTHLPSISYLRLDGSVEGSARYPIVSKFNTDMTIDVLLLTTHVGGLGLNLTTADTVIFMDPDWNPMKDLQAMDRAHRLGQKRVVTVYRLLLQDTLEDRIMSLQRWKTRIAGTVITQQNSEAVNHENILDLFEEERIEVEAKRTGTTQSKSKSKKSKLDPMGKPEWHVEDDSDLAAREAEYDQEFK